MGADRRRLRVGPLHPRWRRAGSLSEGRGSEAHFWLGVRALSANRRRVYPSGWFVSPVGRRVTHVKEKYEGKLTF